MKNPALLTTDLVFIVAWAFPLIMVVIHRARTIPRRLREIEDAFLGPHDRDPKADRPTTPGHDYLSAFRPLEKVTAWKRDDLMQLFRQQFYVWHSWGRYLFPLSLILVVSAVELRFCRDWVEVQLNPKVVQQQDSADTLKPIASPQAQRPKSAGTAVLAWLRNPTPEAMSRVPVPVVLALLGGIVWSIFEIFSRRYSRDLTPQELSEITLRLIASIPIGYAFSQLAVGTWDSALAFSASAFPVREVRRFIRQRTLDKASAVPGSENKPTAHLGQVIDGISNETAARLEELNITTAWDLAYADPVSLMAQTGYSLRLILTWMDQALLVVYFDGNKSALSKLAIPCALDLCEFFKRHCQDAATQEVKPCSDDAAVKDLAQKLDIPASILPERIHSLYIDPHVRFLAKCWYPKEDQSVPAPPRVG